MGVLKLSRDEVRQSKLFRSSVLIWTTTTRSSQKSSTFLSGFARTRMFIGKASTALLSPHRQSIRVRFRILFLFGSALVVHPNHSFVPGRSDFH